MTVSRKLATATAPAYGEPETAPGPLPVLVDEEVLQPRLDWLRASYRAQITTKLYTATVNHVLHQAAELEALVERGNAMYATEVRCPRTMGSNFEPFGTAEQSLEWDPADNHDELFLTPGIVAVAATSMEPFWISLDAGDEE